MFRSENPTRLATVSGVALVACALFGISTTAGAQALQSSETAQSKCEKIFGGIEFKRQIEASAAPTAAVNAKNLKFPKVESGRSATFAVIPSDQKSFKNIFGPDSTFSTATRAEMEEASDGLAGQPRLRLAARQNQGRSELRAFLSQVDAQVVMIVAHNDHGLLKFPDRTEVTLREAAEWAYSEGKVPVFLSCKSADFLAEQAPGVTSALTYREAVEISNRLSERLPENLASVPDLARHLADTLQSLERDVKNRIRIKGIVRRVGESTLIALALVLVACAADDECDLLPG